MTKSEPPTLTLLSALILAVRQQFRRHIAGSHAALANVGDDGIVKVKSVYGFDETITRLKADIEKKGIKFFLAVDQSQLGADAGIKLKPSTLLIFGNPPLGIQFLTSNPDSGLDWPVRLLVRQDDGGQVWAVYTDFGWIAKRHGITDRNDSVQDGIRGDRLDHLERRFETMTSLTVEHPCQSEEFHDTRLEGQCEDRIAFRKSDGRIRTDRPRPARRRRARRLPVRRLSRAA